jgi:L-ribulose-5-phosphate 3-epimerase
VKTNVLSRRRMLAGGLCACAGLTLTSSCASLRGSARVGRKPKGFKLGVCDWTVGKTSKPESFDVAKAIGLDGVQVDFGRGKDQLPLFDAALQQNILQRAEQNQMEVASLAMGVLNDIPYKSDPRAERWVEKAIDVCRGMRTDIILLACFGNGELKHDAKGVDGVVGRLKNIAPRAEKAGVTLAIESWLSAAEHMAIIDRVASPAVKVYYDVGNSNKMGYDIYEEIRILGKLICQFHAKDYDDLYGKGSIDFPRVREAMDEIGYRGWLVMEGVKMPLGVEESCRYDAEYLRTIFPPRVG